jgi:DNA-binding GntR family transcriptional regulator
MYAVVERGTVVPPSRQIADVIRGRIASGEYAPGAMLPSLIALAEEFSVTTNTVRKGLRILKDENLIVTVAGYGTFVAKPG